MLCLLLCNRGLYGPRRHHRDPKRGTKVVDTQCWDLKCRQSMGTASAVVFALQLHLQSHCVLLHCTHCWIALITGSVV